MKWIVIGFFSVVILLSVLFTAGFEFLGVEGPPTATQAVLSPATR